MAVNRMENGYKLYKNGQVIVKHQDNEGFIFEVNGYMVSVYMNNGLCRCDDYQIRSQKEPGSYYCKHLWAAFFKVAELKGIINRPCINELSLFNFLDKAKVA